ncbi:Mce-associated membrane protein [Actinopolymorpha cephalotaxi]|uniref:Mce-associated membrane protein n=1 Tax=Actinopolymorpha cephalotaxi TaxID=504797 RepID=A0A1I2V701_9ACTN|nr:hypothetical protein [Actinopolymorpha cephalotaxi]SFG85145.1 Mce-associated membrane protein [Actinopolymorpha cephalotaxi]
MSVETNVTDPNAVDVSPPEQAGAQPGAEAAGTTAASAKATRRRRTWPVAVLAGTVAVVLAATAALGYRAKVAGEVESARTGASGAARTAAQVVLGYDYRHLDADFGRSRALLTGDFRDKYTQTATSLVRPTATQTHAVVVAEVRSVSVVSATPDQVVTLLYVNQTTTSNRAAEPRTDLNRVRMTMRRVGDRWLVSGMKGL